MYFYYLKKSPDNIISTSTTPSDDIIKAHKNGIKESRKERGRERERTRLRGKREREKIACNLFGFMFQ
jgi:hypothetical protein